VFVAVACSDGSSKPPTTSTPPPTSQKTERKGPPPTPAKSPEAAVRGHLEALQRGDVATSFLFLSDESFVAGLADAADWARRRTQLPAVTGFEITATEGDRVTVELRHKPGLDSFVGLSPGRQTALYVTRAERGGFLVDAEPTTDPILPADADAAKAAAAWAARVQACDQPGARALEAIDPIFLSLRQGLKLCQATGSVEVGPVGRLEPGPVSQDIVGQYSTDALTWARVVPLTAPIRLLVILAPIGNEWKVLGLTEV